MRLETAGSIRPMRPGEPSTEGDNAVLAVEDTVEAARVYSEVPACEEGAREVVERLSYGLQSEKIDGVENHEGWGEYEEDN